MMNIEDLRHENMAKGLSQSELMADPLKQFEKWYEQVIKSDIYEPGAMTLATVDECRRFFRDLGTPAELQAFADRWRVVELLREGKPYREIYELTGVSVTTVGRVARFLADGNGGYQIALQRLDPSH
jgi:TrpR-related protein YerC/YecD